MLFTQQLHAPATEIRLFFLSLFFFLLLKSRVSWEAFVQPVHKIQKVLKSFLTWLIDFNKMYAVGSQNTGLTG